MKSLQPTRFRGRSRPDLSAGDAPKKFKIVQPVNGQNPTENYRGTSTTYANALGYLYHGKPWFTYFDIPLMMRDSWIRFLATLWTSPFSQIEFEVRATSPDVEGYVRRALTQFQKKSAPSLLRSYFFWGFAPGGIEWERKGGNRSNVGRWHIDKVRRVFPQDAKPLVWAKGNKFAGFQTNTTGKVLSPYAFWFAGFEEAGPLHDDPPVSGAYDDWKEYTSRGGARHNQLIFHRRCAVRPSTMYYPKGQTPISGSDGEIPERIDNQTLALAVSEQIESGANVVLPDERTEQGDRRWELVPATPNPDAPGIREYPEWLKKNMAAGVGIPIEVVQAAESGSGWSGRKVPYKAWLSSVDSIAGLFYDTFDIQGLRQGVYETFGPKADYEFACKSLVEKVDAEGDGEGDPKMGGGPPGQGGGGGGGGLIPYRGPNGGSGFKNPQTGRIKYMGDLWQRSRQYADSVMTLEDRQRMRQQVRMSAVQFREDDHPRDDGGQFAEKFSKAIKKKDHLTAHELTNAALDGHHGEDVRAKVSAALDHNLRERGNTKHRHDSIIKSLAGKLEPSSDTVTVKRKNGKEIKRLRNTAGTVARSAEEQLRNLVSYYAGTEGRARTGKADDFVSVIKYLGGINPEDSEMKAAYGSMKGAIEDGIPITVFNKMQKSRLDEISDSLVNDGTMQLPAGRNGPDYLLELIKNRVKASWFDAQHEQDQAEEAYLLAEMEAKHGTNDPAELVEALRRGEADARREVTDSILGEHAPEPDGGDEPEYDPADDWDRGEDGEGDYVERDFLDFTEDPEESRALNMAQLGLFDELEHQRADDGKFAEKKERLRKQVLMSATFSEQDHPRDKNGEFIAKGAIAAAQSDPAKAKELRKQVRPEDAAKLETRLSGAGEEVQKAKPIKKFGKSKAEVKYADKQPYRRQEADDLCIEWLGHDEPETIASIVGAPDDAEVKFGKSTYDVGGQTKPQIRLDISGDGFKATRYLRKNDVGQLYLLNEEFWIDDEKQGAGLGTEIFGRQVENAAESGIDYIRCHAAQENPNNPEKPHAGYYVWPRFGYDMPLDASYGIAEVDKPIFEACRNKFPEAKTILDVFETPEGRSWWKKNGTDLLWMKFDLKPGSRSMQTWEKYNDERASDVKRPKKSAA